jgi:hypothetical protein
MPSEISFSRPSIRYLNRHQRAPLGLKSSYRPRPSNILIAFEPGFAWRMTVSLSGMIEPHGVGLQTVTFRCVGLTERAVAQCIGMRYLFRLGPSRLGPRVEHTHACLFEVSSITRDDR